KFLELGLATEGTAEREKRKKKAAGTKAKSLDKLQTKAQALATKGNLDAVVTLAWENISDAESLKAVETVVRSFPGAEMQWQVFDWIHDRKYLRGNQTNEPEVDALADWFANNDNQRLQPFIWGCLSTKQTQVAYKLLPAIAKRNALDKRFAQVLL